MVGRVTIADAEQVVVAGELEGRQQQARRELHIAGRGVVHRVITELAVVDISPDGFVLREIPPGDGVDQVRDATAAPLTIAADLAEMAPAPSR
jgi:acyl CoA:acetate/3-ketoacid CoA transferase beta subunit